MRVVEDISRIPDLRNELEKLQRQKVQIGVFGEDNSEMLMIARVNEFGTDIAVTSKMRAYLHSIGLHLRASTTQIHIPERPFIRGTFDQHQNHINNLAINGIRSVIMGDRSADDLLNLLGNEIVSLIQEYMVDLSSPPNSSFTINRKGSSNPLIDTGHLRQSITYKIV